MLEVLVPEAWGGGGGQRVTPGHAGRQEEELTWGAGSGTEKKTNSRQTFIHKHLIGALVGEGGGGGDSIKLLPLCLIIWEEPQVLDRGSAGSGTGFGDDTGVFLAECVRGWRLRH